MTRRPLAFYTIDRGSATTAAALIARVSGRWRLLGAGAVPAGVDPECLLGDLARGADLGDPALLAGAGPWQEWTRLESRTAPPPHVLLAAAGEAALGELEQAFAASGWHVAGRLSRERSDMLRAAEWMFADRLSAVAIATDVGSSREREALTDLCALVEAIASRREDLQVILVGGTAGEWTGIAQERVLRAPGASDWPAADEASLRSMAERLAVVHQSSDPADARSLAEVAAVAVERPPADGRLAFQRAITTLAAVLDLRVEGVDIGLDAGTRVVAEPEGMRWRAVHAAAGLLPAAILDDDRLLDHAVAWSPIRAEPHLQRDRLLNLRLAPWRDAAGDGARLRLAAARAALERLDEAWVADEGNALADVAPDLLVASGGGFMAAPAPAVALALADTLRRGGASVLVLDHARILAPLGTLDDETDRRRLLADLADDALLPLGSALLATGLRSGRRATLRVTSGDATTEFGLGPGAVQVVDLPPGLAASVELEASDDVWAGARGRHLAFEVAGGLGGLIVDTREIPLRLPDRPERRREQLEAWQRPLWTGGDT